MWWFAIPAVIGVVGAVVKAVTDDDDTPSRSYSSDREEQVQDAQQREKERQKAQKQAEIVSDAHTQLVQFIEKTDNNLVCDKSRIHFDFDTLVRYSRLAEKESDDYIETVKKLVLLAPGLRSANRVRSNIEARERQREELAMLESFQREIEEKYR